MERQQLQFLREALVAGWKDGQGPKPDAIDLGFQWLFGTGNKVDFFTAGDEFTEQIRNDHSMDYVRAEIVTKIRNGDPDDFLGGYSVMKLEGWPRLLSDATDVLSLGWTGTAKNRTSDGKFGTSTATFLGSYGYKFKVISRDSKTGKAKIGIQIKNDTTITSSTHLPGPAKAYIEKYVVNPLTYIADRFNLPLRTKHQAVYWEEGVNLR
ncbi:hypothetical protein ABR737_41070 [Streptomyces sp. Edi2]|uniref:hypothetical protein n=1 Tax=Streptomyces sp. Edi2 TaxID=3162528 RepID=UPI0033061B2B